MSTTSSAARSLRMLLSPVTLPGFSRALQNRMVLAPMTRSRHDTDGTPSSLAIEYYSQRASGGLLIVEGTQTSLAAQGYARTPGVHTEKHVDAWRRVTDAVHARGAQIWIQLMHAGRIAHSANRLVSEPPVAPSAIRARGQIWTDQQGMQDMAEPRALTLEEIPRVYEEFANATRMALRAGFDGVQLHAASGYLPNQFLSSNANLRTDQYGGSHENRSRFVVEALDAMITAANSSRQVAIKVAPVMEFNDIVEEDPIALYTTLMRAIEPKQLAFVDVLRSRKIDAVSLIRNAYSGTLVVGGGFTADEAETTLTNGTAQLVAFGSSFLANPDLPERFRIGASLNQPDASTFYTPGAKGYIDYPTLEQQQKQK